MYKDNPLLPDKDVAIFKKDNIMTVEEATIFLMETKPVNAPIIIVGDYKKLSPIVLNKCIVIKIGEGE
jgi:redox-sensitive bicupin YhaK (pirin superfamily)